MKRTLLLLTMGALLTASAFAQTQQSGPAGAPPHPAKPFDSDGGPPKGGGMGALTPEERQELRAARQAALQANPALADQLKAAQDKIDAAMIKADPKVAPIIAKLNAAREQHRDGQGGPGGPRDPAVPKPNGDKPGAPKAGGGDKPHPAGN